jgi:hypothetical protein
MRSPDAALTRPRVYGGIHFMTADAQGSGLCSSRYFANFFHYLQPVS